MEQAILIVHVLLAVALVALILLQQGKGAEMGASFGSGASQTLFGSGGTVGFLARATGFLAFGFFMTSFGLAMIASDKAKVSDEFRIEVPAEAEVPAKIKELLRQEGGNLDVPVVPAVDNETPAVLQEALDAEDAAQVDSVMPPVAKPGPVMESDAPAPTPPQ